MGGFLHQIGMKNAAKAFFIYSNDAFLYSVGDCPTLCLKQRLKYFGSVNPQA